MATAATAPAVAAPYRVRQILSSLNPVETATLKKLLPAAKSNAAIKVPEEPAGTRYPAALLSALPDGEEYSLLGFISEDLLRLSPADVTQEALIAVLKTRAPEADIVKVLRSKTTDLFLEHIRATRQKLDAVVCGELQGETEIRNDATDAILVGHPDMRTATQIFEIKMTGQLKKNWIAFLLQVFSYAALAPEVTDLYIVLPIQELVHHIPLAGWKDTQRDAFRMVLLDAVTKRNATEGIAAALIDEHDIGCHVAKQKTLADTILSLPHPSTRPYQIFLSGPQSGHMAVSTADVAEARELIAKFEARVFIHSQYLINLCAPPPKDGSEELQHTGLLIKNLEYAKALGAKGVVVHVGKSTTQDVPTALAHMRANILRAMEHATDECPILLETPAGQGTETLRTYEEFVEFVEAFDDDRLKVCVDSCHVFACGIDPAEYVERITKEAPGLLSLIHFNDSATPCGSYLDRHAFVGQGHVGFETMSHLADLGTAAEVPMLIEY